MASRFFDWCADCGCPRGPRSITHRIMLDGTIRCDMCGATCRPKNKGAN